MSHLAGPVAFIDDELDNTASEAFQLLEEIRATRRPVVTAKSVPTNPEGWFTHWQGLAFAVIDWDLTPSAVGTLGSMGSAGGATLSAFERKKLFDFIVSLMKHVYCPIFIVSAENTDDIKRQIAENQDLLLTNGQLDGRITVFPKNVVLNHLDEYVTAWVDASPALTALTAWAREHDSAKNQLFVELNSEEPDWPLYVWKAAEDDEVDPAYELASVISTNLVNRLNPVTFDLGVMSKPLEGASGAARRRVSQGRTSIAGDKLSDRMVLPGDMFQFENAPDGEVWINISPACHTVGRLINKHDDGTEERESIRLHLLRGNRLAWPSTQGALKDMSKGRSNSIIIHTVLNGDPYKFTFGDARIEEWEAIKLRRVARLLPPYVTRVQQMHAAYIQSEGLPKVTFALYEGGGDA